MFHERFINFVIDAKGKLQNAPRIEMDFVLNITMCSSDLTCFQVKDSLHVLSF